jgi:glutathione S-transferase
LNKIKDNKKLTKLFLIKMIKFYDLIPSTNSTCFFSPNTWKTRMDLLHKGVQFETIPVTLLDVRRDLAARSNHPNISVPAIELPNGKFIYDSFHIAEWLEDTYPDRPSLFTGDGQLTNKAQSEHLLMGKKYARMMDLGLGASKPQWGVWFELFFPQLDQLMSEGEVRDFFRSDARLGPQGYQKLISLDRQQLIDRAKLTVQPLLQILRERPNEYFQGTHPGHVDYIIFGRYAYCRMLDPQLAKQVWEDQGDELSNWIDKLCKAYDGHALKIFQNVE